MHRSGSVQYEIDKNLREGVKISKKSKFWIHFSVEKNEQSVVLTAETVAETLARAAARSKTNIQRSNEGVMTLITIRNNVERAIENEFHWKDLKFRVHPQQMHTMAPKSFITAHSAMVMNSTLLTLL